MQLRDIKVQLQAQYWVSGATAFGDRDSHKGRVVTPTRARLLHVARTAAGVAQGRRAFAALAHA